MTIASTVLRQLALAVLTTLTCVSNAQATSTNALAQAQARYKHDMAICNNGQSNQSVATCRREAGSALAEAKRGTLHMDSAAYQSNALQRCAVHQGDDRVACEARIIGQGNVTTGTEAGGLLRESITVTPAK
ncbi:hypothetical protein [Rhodoferax sp.]|uniref:hypothetical protein n=1 Tax=Rhodoferax sp. TaxID=50421 RepID=UPI002845DD05|nr:hypothetical protein [Rhodoferax sp.]MDR3369000.1 hypothetical protein [Rhodoferax sp.]